jgi:hypothetical protein
MSVPVIEPPRASQASPPTVGGASSMASVGVSASGSWARKYSRFSRRDPSISQQITPMPKAAHAADRKPTCATVTAATNAPATVGRKYPGCASSGSWSAAINCPVSRPPTSTVLAAKTPTITWPATAARVQGGTEQHGGDERQRDERPGDGIAQVSEDLAGPLAKVGHGEQRPGRGGDQLDDVGHHPRQPEDTACG